MLRVTDNCLSQHYATCGHIQMCHISNVSYSNAKHVTKHVILFSTILSGKGLFMTNTLVHIVAYYILDPY